MRRLIKNWISPIPKYMKPKVLCMFLLIIISAFVELFSIGSIIPLFIYMFGENVKSENFTIIILENLADNLDFVKLILLFIFAYFLKSVYLIYFNYFKSMFIRDLENYLTNTLFEKYHLLDLSSFKKISSGEIIRNLTKEISLYCSGFSSFIYLLSELLILLIFIILLLFVDIKVTIAVLTILSFFGLILLNFTFSKLSNLGTTRAKAEKDKVQNILGFINLFPETKLYKALPTIKPVFANFTSSASTSMALFNFIGQIPRIFMELAAFSVLGIILIISHFYNYSDQKMLILVSIFGIVGLRILPSVNRLVNTSQVVRFNSTSKEIIDRIFKSIEEKINKRNLRYVYPKVVRTNEKISKLEVKKLSYSFDKNGKPLFKKLSFIAVVNEPVCIIAPSGKGKSTLLEVISGLRIPDTGDVIYHKNKTTDNPINIGYVGQKVFLFPATIKENLLFGNNSSVEDDDIWKSLKICGMYKFVKNIGLNFQVNEGGNSLSGGQVQRLGIARAILKKPNILILDEVTSGLDNKIELKIISDLHKFMSKSIIIHASHSQIVKSNCKQQIVLK